MKAPLRIWRVSIESEIGCWVMAGRVVEGVIRDECSRQVSKKAAHSLIKKLAEQAPLLILHTNERLSKK